MSSGIIRRMLEASADEVILMDGGMGSMVEDRGIDVKTAIWGSYCFVDGAHPAVNDQFQLNT